MHIRVELPPETDVYLYCIPAQGGSEACYDRGNFRIMCDTGYSLHVGMVVVADSTTAVERHLQRVQISMLDQP